MEELGSSPVKKTPIFFEGASDGDSMMGKKLWFGDCAGCWLYGLYGES